MAVLRIAVPLLILSLAAQPVRALEESDDDRMFGGMLALAQQFVRLAAESPDPQAMRKGVDAMLAGENVEANRLASGIFDDVLLDFPPAQRAAVSAIGRDLLIIARREQRKSQSLEGISSEEKAIQARKELHAMGLRYWDEQQFLEAARRGDRIAVELYLAARGLESRNPPPAR
jgi:hypothetical protein